MTGVRIVARASGGPLDVPDWTLVDVVLRTARDHGERPAFLGKDGEVRATWAQAEARVRRVAQALVGLGVRPGDRVGIVADTREEWVVADVAILMVGGVSVSVFRSFPAHAIQDALRHSGVRLAFVEDAEVLAKCGDVLDRAIVMEGAIDPSEKRALAFAALDAEPTPEIDARIAALRADDPAVILYTSGTTGKPKGAVLTHRNLVSNSVAAIRHLQLPPHPIGLAFLPIAHSYMRQAAVVLILLGGSVAFSAPKLMQQDLPRIRPTLLPSVPRLYERAYERIQERVRGMLPHRRAIFRAAVATAREYGRLKMQGAPIPAGLRRRHALFELLVYRKIRKMAGLDRLDLAITGAAAMRADLLQFYWGVGLPIAEGYGLTETAAPSNVNPRHAARPGTVGPPLPGVEIGIAEDGEVLIAGPNVFQGYDRLPAETAESFVELEGKRWLLTGDIGVLEDGYLRIVDRKKELEVLDTGKKVAPLPIEERLKEADLVGEAVVIGHQRKYVGCLVQPAFEALEAFARSRGIAYDASRTRRAAGVTGETGVVEVDPALLEHPEVRAAYAAEVERVNATLAGYERIKEFRLLASALSADRGEITPTLKKRRKAILESRRADVDALFIR